MTRDDLTKVHPCPIPDHTEFGVHYHEIHIEGGYRYVLYEVPPVDQPEGRHP